MSESRCECTHTEAEHDDWGVCMVGCADWEPASAMCECIKFRRALASGGTQQTATAEAGIDRERSTARTEAQGGES